MIHACWCSEVFVCYWLYSFIAVIHCVPPVDGVNATYSPVQVEYEWKSEVEYECMLGYNYSSGDMQTVCNHDKTWNGTQPVCTSMFMK